LFPYIIFVEIMRSIFKNRNQICAFSILTKYLADKLEYVVYFTKTKELFFISNIKTIKFKCLKISSRNNVKFFCQNNYL